jgi:N-acetylglucosaminyl-diphospho-decaprenol L-rhamnosyltransferase
MITREAKMNNKELTIIIVTFNSAEIIEKCLKSFDISKYEVLVIDNNSSDKTVEIVKKYNELVNVIENSNNLGFGRANNIGLNQAQTPFALILNPDVQIRDIDIETCLKHLKNNPQIALASPYTLSEENFENTEKYKNNEIIYCDFVVGGIMFMNLENVKKFGFFDEQFFMFAEDSVICDNSILNGFKNAIFNDAFALHIGGKSSTKTLKTHFRRFWHLGWSKTKYKQKRKNIFNYIRSTLRICVLYFCQGIFYFLLQNKEKSGQKFAFCFGSFACFIGMKAFDKNNNPRG